MATTTKPIALDETLQRVADALEADSRYIVLPYVTASSGITLALNTAVYKAAFAADGTFPSIDAQNIAEMAAYYQFEMEIAVPATVPSTFTGPSGWTFLDGQGLPDPADLTGGEVIYISCRMDCGTSGKPVLASVWRVA